MSNPFHAALGGSQTPQGSMTMIQQFNQFRKSFQGDPKEEVQKLLSSGRINQDQLNQLYNTAKQIQSMLQ